MRAMFAVAVVLLAGPALAQERPPLSPTRDSTVIYKLLGRDTEGRTMKMSQPAGGKMARMEMGEMPGYMLFDRESGRGSMVMVEQRMYMEMGGDRVPKGAQGLEGNARFTRKGSETIAGQRCTVWDYVAEKNQGTVCVMAEGIMLRVLDREGSGMEATNVSFAALPPGSYAPPAGFQKMEIPNFGGRGGAPGGLSLPPGVTLPPGVKLPPGMVVPSR